MRYVIWRTLRRPLTIAIFFLFIVIIEIPVLAFIYLNGLSAIGSREFFGFLWSYKNVYNGSYHFSFSDIVHGNLFLLYLSIGFIVAITCVLTLARRFQHQEYLFDVELEEIMRGAEQYQAQFLRDLGHPEFQAPMRTEPKTSPLERRLFSLIKGLLWAVVCIPVWPGLIAYVVKIKRRLNSTVAERSYGLSTATVKRLMANDYEKIDDVFHVIDPPNMDLSNEQQLALLTAADDLRHYEDESLAIIFESGPHGTIAIIRKIAIEKVQSRHRNDRSVRTFADLLNAFKHAGYEIDRN